MAITIPNRRSNERAALEPPLSNGEIHFLWWFIHGSIVSPATRDSLWKAWGMCERHSWAFLSVEASLRQGYLHGPAILYEDLMTRAQALFEVRGPLQPWRILKRFRDRARCLMCAGGYGPGRRGTPRPEIARKALDASELRTLALETAPYWRSDVCGQCAGEHSAVTCRRHLVVDLSMGKECDLSRARELVESVARHLKAYCLSFRFGYHGTATAADRASLISAVGWCSGWKPLLSMVAGR